MPRLKLTLAYTGTNYAGWQIQAHSNPPQPPTVQAEIEQAMAALLGRPAKVHGSSRTDSGVHAEGQTAHVDVPEEKRSLDWMRALNARLPRDIRVLAAKMVEESFHTRFQARAKEYSYCLWPSAAPVPPRLQAFCWSTPPLDTNRMMRAAAHLTGCHDFASFRNTGTLIEDTCRTLYAVTPLSGMAGPFTCPPDWPALSVLFLGNGFLKQMVRNLMGLLVWVGRGKLDPDAVPDLLAARDRTALPSPAAPAKGLTLMRVLYENHADVLGA